MKKLAVILMALSVSGCAGIVQHVPRPETRVVRKVHHKAPQTVNVEKKQDKIVTAPQPVAPVPESAKPGPVRVWWDDLKPYLVKEKH